MMELPRRHFCPVCGSFMGMTRKAGDLVTCSWAEYDEAGNACAENGYAYHDLLPDDVAIVRRPGQRLWESPVRFTGQHAPNQGETKQ